ncbi:Cof-type HAD-IIB family hydrolase [Lacticaseibacillus daqingensis]|uniref:Cof-type HAD-IIB family hydrolase n=1 Tax=Lacticaseibacillus daqingensis TaxID=2486014 RepID=UPI000F7661A9|nr:Cof-type HAD-IIB family hydrolase [Lacticaseibacillus daqingensis]
MIKLIASDMDGTLLNDKMQVSAGNAAAIKAAQAAGIEFMVATGRNITEAKPLIEEHGLTTAFIALNGARVYNEAGELKVDVPLGADILPQIVQILQARHIYFELVTAKGVVSDNKVARIQNVADLLVNLNPDTTYKIAVALAAARLELMNITYVDDYAPILADPTTEVMKIIAFSSEGQAALAEPQALLEATGRLVVTSSARTNIEINDIKAQKGFAVQAYAAQQGITMDEVMTIGDNLNDASMIRMAKYGVAMGNAIPAIKDLAWTTTAINTEDGVAQAITKAIALNASEK